MTHLFNNSFEVVTEVDRLAGVMRRQKVAQVFNDHVSVIVGLFVILSYIHIYI